MQEPQYEKDFCCTNGISVGYSDLVVEATIKEDPVNGTITDFDKGIIYWLKNRKVKQIVIAHKIRKR